MSLLCHLKLSKQRESGAWSGKVTASDRVHTEVYRNRQLWVPSNWQVGRALAWCFRVSYIECIYYVACTEPSDLYSDHFFHFEFCTFYSLLTYFDLCLFTLVQSTGHWQSPSIWLCSVPSEQVCANCVPLWTSRLPLIFARCSLVYHVSFSLGDSILRPVVWCCSDPSLVYVRSKSISFCGSVGVEVVGLFAARAPGC